MIQKRVLFVGFVPATCLLVMIGGCIIIGTGSHHSRQTVWTREVQRVETLSAPLEEGGCIEATTHNGSITVEGVDGRTCEVEARILVSGADERTVDRYLRGVRVELRTTGKGLEIVTHQPQQVNGSIRIDLTIRAPREAKLVLVSHNGEISVSSMAGDVQASTHNGNVRAADTAGDLGLSTDNGSVDCRGARGDVRIVSHNGPVDLAHAADADAADVDVETWNGPIAYTPPTALPGHVKISSRNGKVRLKRPLNVGVGGGRTHGISGDLVDGTGTKAIRLKTRNGEIVVR